MNVHIQTIAISEFKTHALKILKCQRSGLFI